ncbi:hypothetical protein LMG9964_03477 [Paraburkholderia phenoliruptrix]|uniref:Uncharacterized protein n=2 Tax=Paraburkholderia phenoliruptrix TaxID=252970 RepID=K0DEZ1_9BURK|nr:hypothetical protein BUPH_08560 [Paraburkholderia phenoliruptrix BR3459a]MDR6388066.1 hypothetical protein [Paraburkholderia phenoliruptrix]CAB4049816.1 hypothetical protein LMG9964_03477 [Paraburkholderia phenoliruptrix]
MPESTAAADPQRVREHAASSRNPPGRFPVQFLIFVLSQKPARAAFVGRLAAIPAGRRVRRPVLDNGRVSSPSASNQPAFSECPHDR